MKKIFTAILAVFLAFSLCACTKNDTPKVITPADSFARGSGTEADPYIISTPEELLYLQLAIHEQDNADYLDGHFRLGANIDLGGNAWTPIGKTADGDVWPFKGTFDGAGKTIKNFVCQTEETNSTRPIYLGLFAALGGTVKNLTVDHCTVTGGAMSYAGAITGTLQEGGLLENCSVGRKSTITGDLAGGLTGSCMNASLENCANAASVTGLRLAGGVAGSWEIPDQMGSREPRNFRMANCSNSGSITSGRCAGGVVGDLSAYNVGEITLNNCSNAGAVTLDRGLDYDETGLSPAAGGIVGVIRGLDHEQQIGLLACSNAGSVNAKNSEYAGGLVGVGGTKGSLTLLSCANTGEIAGGVDAGGLAGRMMHLENVHSGVPEGHTPQLSISACSNAGEVSGAVVGGLLGALCDPGVALEATIENCVNSANVTVSATGGGLIGGMTNAIPARLAYCTCDGDVIAKEGAQFNSLTGYLGGLVGLVRDAEPELDGCNFTGELDNHEDERYLTSETYIFDH